MSSAPYLTSHCLVTSNEFQLGVGSWQCLKMVFEKVGSWRHLRKHGLKVSLVWRNNNEFWCFLNMLMQKKRLLRESIWVWSTRVWQDLAVDTFNRSLTWGGCSGLHKGKHGIYGHSCGGRNACSRTRLKIIELWWWLNYQRKLGSNLLSYGQNTLVATCGVSFCVAWSTLVQSCVVCCRGPVLCSVV